MTEKNEKEVPISDIDWDDRILCSDGNCIGVIGPDGRCKECGRPYEGDLPPQSPGEEETSGRPKVSEKAAESGAAEESVAEPEAKPAVEAASETAGDVTADDDWGKRILCSDGNCIGVIGPDGRCKECGKPKPESA